MLRNASYLALSQVLYGHEEPIDDGDWTGTTRQSYVISVASTHRAPYIAMRKKLDTHVHSLSTLVGYDCPNFAYMTKRLTGILERIDDLRRSYDQEITFCDIRQQLIRAPLAHLCFVYRPLKALDVSLGDIGYMDDDSFVKVVNIKDDFEFSTVVNGNVDYVHSAPIDFETDHPLDGVVK